MKKGSGKSICLVIALSIILGCLGCKAKTTNKEDKTAAFRKREYIGSQETYGLYPGSLPCVGKPQIVVIVIDFLDDEEFEYSLDDINNRFFDIENYKNGIQPIKGKDNDYFSLRDFYLRASYGKLDINGSCYSYTTLHEKAYYQDAYSLVEEVMLAFDGEKIDWASFDGNSDGYVDGLYFVLRNYPQFPTPHFVATCDFQRAGLKIYQFAFIVGMATASGVQTLAHETCHMFGLPDIYGGVYLNKNGSGANTIMDGPDYALGDLPGIMKYILDWVEPQFVDELAATEYSLRSFSVSTDCLVVFPHGDKNNNNWFFIEYITAEENNFYTEVETGGGLRIWRLTMDPEFSHEDFFPMNSPYTYLEAIHHEGKWDYFLYSGDCFTPHTTLNSNYPLTFMPYTNGGIAMDKMQDSGIYLQDIKIVDGKASFSIMIANSTKR